MLLVDYRAGSKELLAPLRKVFGDSMVEETSLDFGDVAFAGKGPEGSSLEIGIEYKKLGEMVTSMRDGRFSGHQLPGMLGKRGMFDYGWLLIEGEWRIDKNGFMTTLQFRKGQRPDWKPMPGKMRAVEYEKHLLTYELCGGVHVRNSRNRDDSIRAITDLYRWWNDKAIDAHTSHLTQHKPAAFAAVSEFRQAVSAWPGVGLKMSAAVETFTTSITDCAGWTVAGWANIETEDSKGNTRRFGEAKAQKLVNFLRGVKS